MTARGRRLRPPNEVRQATASPKSRFARFAEPPPLPFSSHFQPALRYLLTQRPLTSLFLVASPLTIKDFLPLAKSLPQLFAYSLFTKKTGCLSTLFFYLRNIAESLFIGFFLLCFLSITIGVLISIFVRILQRIVRMYIPKTA